MRRHFECEDGSEDLTGFITSGTNGSLQQWVPDGRPDRLARPAVHHLARIRALRDEMARIADMRRMQLTGMVN